jgi:mannose-6-phosphate isomerase
MASQPSHLEVAMRPILLPANQPPTFYRGAGRIAAFRGARQNRAGPALTGRTLPDQALPEQALPEQALPDRPEDWVGSTTTRFGRSPSGLTTLPDGRQLRAAVEADPIGWLGRDHLDRFGPGTALLVKLLDAGERLPVHAHPTRDFARSHLASPYGKTEAWVIVEAAPGAEVHLGFSRDVEPGELARWVADQEIETMLAATNRVPVRAGDAVLVPAGLPHSTGEGVLLVELQEPTDFSVLLEWKGFAIDGAAEGHLGLGFDLALQCVDRGAWSRARVEAELLGPTGGRPLRDGLRLLMPAGADPYLRAERVDAQPRVLLDAGFAVLVVTAGCGLLAWAEGEQTLDVAAGDTVLMPHGAGAVRVEGPLSAVRCRPPAAP